LANPYTRVVVAAWDAVSERMSGRFSMETVEEEMETRIGPIDIEALRASARHEAVRGEDKRRRELANLGSNVRFWDDSAFQGAIPAATGETQRVTLDAAENADWLYFLQVKQKHMNEAVARLNVAMNTYSALAPYLSVPGTKTADARAAWLRDNPDAQENV